MTEIVGEEFFPPLPTRKPFPPSEIQWTPIDAIASCGICGAAVDTARQRQHAEWHAGMVADYLQMHDRADWLTSAVYKLKPEDDETAPVAFG